MDITTQTETQEEYWKDVVNFWKEKTTEALEQVEALKEKIFILEKEIEKQRGKTYLEDLMRDDQLFRESNKVCSWVLACLRTGRELGPKLILTKRSATYRDATRDVVRHRV